MIESLGQRPVKRRPSAREAVTTTGHAVAAVAIEALFAAFRVRGESPWEKIVRREQAGLHGQEAPESGDLIVLSRPGFHFSKRLSASGSPVGIPTESPR